MTELGGKARVITSMNDFLMKKNKRSHKKEHEFRKKIHLFNQSNAILDLKLIELNYPHLS